MNKRYSCKLVEYFGKSHILWYNSWMLLTNLQYAQLQNIDMLKLNI
jgi:hypothetical protein